MSWPLETCRIKLAGDDRELESAESAYCLLERCAQKSDLRKIWYGDEDELCQLRSKCGTLLWSSPGSHEGPLLRGMTNQQPPSYAGNSSRQGGGQGRAPPGLGGSGQPPRLRSNYGASAALPYVVASAGHGENASVGVVGLSSAEAYGLAYAAGLPGFQGRIAEATAGGPAADYVGGLCGAELTSEHSAGVG